MGWDASAPQLNYSVKFRSIYNGADESLTGRGVLIASTRINVQSYAEEHPATYVKVSTSARRIKTNKSSTFLESRDRALAAVFVSLMEDGMEIDAELGKCQNAAGKIETQQVSRTDEVQLSSIH